MLADNHYVTTIDNLKKNELEPIISIEFFINFIIWNETEQISLIEAEMEIFGNRIALKHLST